MHIQRRNIILFCRDDMEKKRSRDFDAKILVVIEIRVFLAPSYQIVNILLNIYLMFQLIWLDYTFQNKF